MKISREEQFCRKRYSEAIVEKRKDLSGRPYFVIKEKMFFNYSNSPFYLPAYYLILFICIVIAASISYKFIEQPILSIQKKLKQNKKN